MNFIKRFFYSLKVKFTVMNKFKHYIETLQRELNTYKLIELPSNDMLDLAQKVKLSNFKNHKLLYEKYSNLVNLVNEQNEQIKSELTLINEFNYDDILMNMDSYSLIGLKRKYHNLYFKLKTKKLAIDDFKNFKKYYEILITDFDIINELYKLYKAQLKIINLSNYDYIDFYIETELTNDFKAIDNELKNYRKLYYPFCEFETFKNSILIHNEEFIAVNLNNEIFSDVNGKSLDRYQREAVLKDEIANLTIAGAGSGKTLTICGKLKFLLEKGYNPKDILIMSYSKKSVEDLNIKIKGIDERLEAKTFHALGLEILSRGLGVKQTVFNQFDAVIEEYFRTEIFNNKQILDKFLTYQLLYSYETDSPEEKYDYPGDYYKKLKNEPLYTLKRELVKSVQELMIANFYYLHGINYEYEKPYKINLSTALKRNYLPDFYLPDYDVYHEHYGINREGKSTIFSDLEASEYNDKINWKRDIHNCFKTKCIETFSYNFTEDTWEEELTKALNEQGVIFKELDKKELLDTYNSIYEGINFKSFIALIKSFINLYKSEYKDEEGFELLKQHKYESKYQRKRANLFLDICKEVYCFYRKRLEDYEEIDFDDMILESIKILPKINFFKYKYIIVDEFQDITKSRMLFLQELVKHGVSKLFVVGDDWQSIYRFAGCNLSIFLGFKELFKRVSINKIPETHRNSQELQNVMEEFVTTNEIQIPKQIHSNLHLDDPIQIAYYLSNKTKVLINLLKHIEKIDKNANILILGRHSFDIDNVLCDYFNFSDNNRHKITCKICKDLNISYSTIHQAKGLEEDYVIVLNNDDDLLGFPNKIENDSILNLVLANDSEYPYDEERRLFYVALTRTRKYVYLLVDYNNPSIFVEEIKDKVKILNPPKDKNKEKEIYCPSCKSGILSIVESKDGKKYLSCSNHPYCNYAIFDLNKINKRHRCPYCHDFLVLRKSKTGHYFYGCHNLMCDYTESVYDEQDEIRFIKKAFRHFF